jgi:tetratricopeptide (TPR) repeat protein
VGDSVTAKQSRRHAKSRSILMLAAALAVAPVLTAQGNDQPQTRSNALALEQQGHNAEAEQVWNDIAKANPQNAEAFAHLGLLEARQEHYDTAIDNYRHAAAINSNLPGLQLNLGLALFKAAQFPAAIESFSSELIKHPGDQRLTILLGMAHFGLKDYLVAIPYLKRATEGDPQSLTLRMTLMQSCMASKQYQCVLSVQQEILKLNDESAEVDMSAGEAFDQLRDSASAEKEFRAASKINPKAPNVHFGLGYLLWTQRKWADAASEFQLELQNDPGHQRARTYLADSWVRQNQFATALPELEKLAAANPSDPLVHRDLGMIYADAGRSQDAIRELNLSIESDPGDAESHRLLARLYRSKGKSHEADAEFAKANRLPPQSPSTLQEIIASIDNPAP